MNVEIFLHALTSYFVIIDPVGTALIFHGLTSGCSDRYSFRMAVRSIFISLSIVMVFGFWGETLLLRLGIGIDSLRVAGGFLLFYTAFNMITRPGESLENDPSEFNDISVYPMSIPLISGPGCLTLTILLFSNSKSRLDLLSVIIAVLIIFVVTFFTLILSSKIDKLIGETGGDIIKRLLGVILAALAVQFIIDGVRQIVQTF